MTINVKVTFVITAGPKRTRCRKALVTPQQKGKLCFFSASPKRTRGRIDYSADPFTSMRHTDKTPTAFAACLWDSESRANDFRKAPAWAADVPEARRIQAVHGGAGQEVCKNGENGVGICFAGQKAISRPSPVQS